MWCGAFAPLRLTSLGVGMQTTVQVLMVVVVMMVVVVAGFAGLKE